jgi:hypothetical protein
MARNQGIFGLLPTAHGSLMNFILRCFTLVASVILVFTAETHAAFLTVLNPSFESPVTAPGTFTGLSNAGPPNWTVYNTITPNSDRFFGVWNPTGTDSYQDPIPHGSNVGVVFLDNDTGIAEAGLRQTLASTLQLATQYTLTVQVGNFNPGMTVSPWDFSGFPGYRVDLLAGSTVLASDNNTLAPAEGRFLASTVSFTTGASHANAGQALAIRLVNLNGPGVEVNFDAVALEAVAVPEPATLGWILIAVGTASFDYWKRKRAT